MALGHQKVLRNLRISENSSTRVPLQKTTGEKVTFSPAERSRHKRKQKVQ
jgi:hypothetical protein